jgi:hypothetical protein
MNYDLLVLLNISSYPVFIFSIANFFQELFPDPVRFGAYSRAAFLNKYRTVLLLNYISGLYRNGN